MNGNDDPRLGLPSGSAALENSMCLGRHNAQKLWVTLTEGDPEETDGSQEDSKPSDDMDRDAAAGIRIHKLYAGEAVTEAKEAERNRAAQALEVDTKIHQTWVDFFKAEPEEQIVAVRERRWWMKDDSGQPIYSGQTDLLKIRGHANGQADILIGDLKGLWGYHDDATLNLQLRHYIGLVASGIGELGYIGVRSAACYLNQPAITMSPKLALFDHDDVEQTVQEVFLHAMAVNDPDASRTAGPIQCHRCQAKLICQEYQDYVQTLPVIVAPFRPEQPVPVKAVIEHQVTSLTGEKLAELLPWLPAMDNVVALAKAEAKRRLKKDPESVPGWQLKPNRPRSKITDLIEVYNRLSRQYNVKPSDFVKVCSISGENLEEITRAASGLKGKALAEKVRQLKDGCFIPIPVSDSLEEIK